MALVICPECKGEVSDQAKACPKCGYPISRGKTSLEGSNSDVVTVEQTSKRLKLHELWSVIAILLGGIIVVASSFVARREDSGWAGVLIGIVVFLAGFVWYIVTRIRRWWKHG